MKPIDILLVAIIVVWFILALWRIVKTKKSGGCMGCGGGCSCRRPEPSDEKTGCNCHTCSHCKEKDN